MERHDYHDTMKRSLLAMLPPRTSLVSQSESQGEVLTGQLLGPFGTAPIVDGVPRFVSDEAYAGSFGRQWRRFARVQLDSASGRPESYHSFVARTGLDPADFAGRRVLDVGCGAGRYMELFADAGAEIVGVDLSRASEVAWRNVGRRPGAHVAQADALQLPFCEASFDLVFSIGVLHHTPAPEQATRTLARLVRPGGVLAIWVYARSPLAWADRLDGIYRGLTRRISDDVLFGLAHVAIPLGAVLRRLQRVPVVGTRLVAIYLSLLPKVSIHPDARWRVLDTFDWWSPRHRSFHTYPEVETWFRAAGLVRVRRLPVPVAVRGERPG